MVTLQSSLTTPFPPLTFSSSFTKLIRVCLVIILVKVRYAHSPKNQKVDDFLAFPSHQQKAKPFIGTHQVINRPYGPNTVSDGTKTIITAVRFLKDLDFLFLPRAHIILAMSHYYEM
jgi:hypothetical protein